MGNNFKSEKDYYYSDFKKKFDEYFKAEKEHEDYRNQFFGNITNGKIIKKATKSFTFKEFKEIRKLKERKENKRQLLREAEIKLLSINRQSR